MTGIRTIDSAGMQLRRDWIPVMSPHAKLTWHDKLLVVDAPDAEVTYGRTVALQAERLLSACSAVGPEALELARRENLPWSTLIELLQPAVDAGVIWDASAFMRARDEDSQLDAYYALCDSWARDVFTSRFWSLMLSGKASTSLVLGWCEQFYHRTVGADEHNALAVEHCHLADVREQLSEHFSEELGHGEIFLAGLAAAGVSRNKVEATPALLSTRRLIEFMNDLGCRDTLAYLACYGVLHSPREGQTLGQVRAQFAEFARLYPAAAPAIVKVGEHAELDVAAGHDQIVFEKYLRTHGCLTSEEARRALRAARGTVEVFNGFFAGILDEYG